MLLEMTREVIYLICDFLCGEAFEKLLVDVFKTNVFKICPVYHNAYLKNTYLYIRV